MSWLSQGLPQDMDGYLLHTDFRIWLGFETALAGVGSAGDLLPLLCRYFISTPPDNPRDAIGVLMSFYLPHEEDPHHAGKKIGLTQRSYDFERDYDLLYAAFWGQYGIDLTVAQLHWWQFRALFRNLNDSNRLVKVMEYRSVELSEIQDPQQRRFYRQMRGRYRLPPIFHRDTEEIGEVFGRVMGPPQGYPSEGEKPSENIE